MFAKACTQLQKSLYVVGVSSTAVTKNDTTTVGTGFLIAPNILATVAHLFDRHRNGRQMWIEVSSLPAVLQSAPGTSAQTTPATVLAQDAARDLTLLRLTAVQDTAPVRLVTTPIGMGTSCGVMGFPHAEVQADQNIRVLERFRGGHIAAYRRGHDQEDHPSAYEIDTLLFPGASGSPVFLPNGRVLGMVLTGGQEEQRSGFALLLAAAEIAALAQANGVQVITR
jgi:S1-C subfamily serine protease